MDGREYAIVPEYAGGYLTTVRVFCSTLHLRVVRPSTCRAAELFFGSANAYVEAKALVVRKWFLRVRSDFGLCVEVCRRAKYTIRGWQWKVSQCWDAVSRACADESRMDTRMQLEQVQVISLFDRLQPPLYFSSSASSCTCHLNYFARSSDH